jgi:hypothetical protein
MALFPCLAAQVQQVDIAAGDNILISPRYNNASLAYLPAQEKGDMYPSFSAEVLLKNRLGFSGEVAWRWNKGLYNGYQDFRPVLYDVNGVFAPRLGKKMTADFMAGAGGESVIFYNQFATCNPAYGGACVPRVNANHFLVHLGGGVRYYFWRRAFVRPEAHFYWIQNNQEFTSDNLLRVGISIGYSFRRE